MYLKDLSASVRRRWMLVPVLLLIAGSLWWAASTKVGPEYEAEATVLLVPPRASEDPGANRFLGLGSVAYSVDVVARSLTSTRAAEDLAKAAPGAVYTVLPDPTTSAPLLVVTTTSGDGAAAIKLMHAVLDRIPTALRNIQAEIDIPVNRQIVVSPIATDQEAQVNQKPRIRTLGALAVGLLGMVALVIGSLDGLLLRRAARGKPGGDAAASVDDSAESESRPGSDQASDGTSATAGPKLPSQLKIRLVVARR